MSHLVPFMPIRPTRAALAATLLATLAATPASAETLTWSGGNAVWTIGTNWTPTGPPGADDVAVVNTGNAQLNAPATVLGFNQGGGAVSGTGVLTATGPSTWTAGTQDGTGTTRYDGTLAISGGAQKTTSGGRTLNLNGATTWTGGNFSLNNSTIINNAGTFTDSTSDRFLQGLFTFNNSGTFTKASAATTTLGGVVFNNTGTVNVDAGTIRVNNAVDNQGIITTATAATFGTSGAGSDLQNHGILQGTGTYDPAAGRTVLNAGVVRPGTATSVGDLTMAGNYTQVADGLLQINLASLSDFDTMAVELGNLALNGVLQVTSLDAYNPVVGDMFTIITFDDGVADVSDLAGAFSSLVPVGFDPTLVFGVLYNEHSVVLSVVGQVPLPPAWPLAATAVAFALARARRRRA